MTLLTLAIADDAISGASAAESLRQWQVSFAAPWATDRPVLVLFAAAAAVALSLLFYYRFQRGLGGAGRLWLAVARGALLAALVVILADPVLIRPVRDESAKPLLLLVFDGSESMAFKDKLSGDDVRELANVIKDEAGRPVTNLDDVSRLELVSKVLSNRQNTVFDDLARDYRIRAYLMDQLSEVRELNLATEKGKEDEGRIERDYVAKQLSAVGRVSALGAALDDLARRHRRQIAGVVMFSDFDQNTGRDAVVAAQTLKAPIFTVGVGPPQAIDLAAELQSSLVLKKDEDAEATVIVRQTGLTGRVARVQLLGRRLGAAADAEAESNLIPLAPAKTVELTGERVSVSLPFTPHVDGRYLLVARVDPFDDEVLTENNTAEREVTIHDEALKLLFVEYEPTWEWRFVKEVFHRDKLIGREGFRTYLRSADIKVRRTNDLFLESLVQPRSQFFAHDVIFISDVPGDMLSEHFQQMLQEFVYEFGGGLVVIAGPRFGPGALSQTKIANMLPVVVDPTGRPKQMEFRLQMTPKAKLYPFMQLGKPGDESENQRAWDNLGRVPWYQPVLRVVDRADVLAQHPIDKCAGTEQQQPLIAAHRYGKGEVIYVGFNEFWRLRRKYGERYYRQFWGQMINRLGLGRALGAQKRFQVNTDRKTYEAGDKVRLVVEAYDENFQKLAAERLAGRLMIEPDGGTATTTDLSIPLREVNFYEATLPVFTAGRHRVLVRDPVTQQEYEVNFKVAPVTLERRSAIRNVRLQRDLADATGGHAYELHEIAKLKDDLAGKPTSDYRPEKTQLWNSRYVLALMLTLMLGEWLSRKLLNMR